MRMLESVAAAGELNGLPGGGVRHGARLSPWRWVDETPPRSAGVRCQREQWYLLRGRRDAAAPQCVVVEFFDEEGTQDRRCVELSPGGPLSSESLGWVRSPKRPGRLRIEIPDASRSPESLVLYPVEERDPKCHPLSNTPRWSVHRPPFPIERIFLPRELATLGESLPTPTVILDTPASLKRLAQVVQGSACVLSPDWVRQRDWTMAQIEQLASLSWVVVDLETIARLSSSAGRAETRVETYHAAHGLMSARVEYSDVETRGFSLQDVFPFAHFDARGRFATRVLKRTRSWKRYADQTGFATLLASETPWSDRSGDVLTAASAVGSGELVASDVPWLAAGRFGPLAAPRLMRHLLGTHLGQPVADDLQYWNRWDDEAVVLRDLAELEKRYAELRTVRWAGATPGVAQVGIELTPADGAVARCRLMLRTGRIDQRDPHDGIPPEAMAIFMKWLAREARERTSWSREHLAGISVCWQFDSAAGLRYALQYAAADGRDVETRALRVRARRAGAPALVAEGPSTGDVMSVDAAGGLCGDHSLDVQRNLSDRLRGWIEENTRGVGRPGSV